MSAARPVLLLALIAAALPAWAEPESVAPAAADAATAAPWSGSAGIYSQYVSRGVSYTSERPAAQASVQYTSPTGWYAGFWTSNVSDAFLAGATLETDPYGGYASRVGEIDYDLGFWRWTFLGARQPNSRQAYDTVEWYLGASWRWLAIKYWREATDYFGLNALSAGPDFGLPARGGSSGSHYLEANLAFDLGQGWTLGLHAAHQTVRHYGALDFNDYRIGLDKDLGAGWVASAAYSETTADPHAYAQTNGLNTARGKLIAALRCSF